MTVRVCLVTGEYPPSTGGIADYTHRLAYAMHAAGADVSVLTHRRDRTRAQRVRHDPVHVYRAIPRWDAWLASRVRRAARLLGADVVHVQYQTAAYGMTGWIGPVNWWVRRAGMVSAVTYHDLREPYLFPKAGRVRGWITRMPARHSDLVIATTVADADELAAHDIAATVVPIGSNIGAELPDAFSPSAWREANSVADGVLIGYFGMRNASKGVARLPALLESLLSAGHDARLVLIGAATGASDPTNEATSRALDAELSRRGLAERTLSTGTIPGPDVAAWLRTVDAVVLPYEDGASFRRGSLLAALESGAAIVTTTPAHPDTDLVHERDLLLVPAGDDSALRSAVARLLTDAALARSVREGARRIAAQFGWPDIARRHLALYERALGA